jgi:hypothetical protein
MEHLGRYPPDEDREMTEEWDFGSFLPALKRPMRQWSIGVGSRFGIHGVVVLGTSSGE